MASGVNFGTQQYFGFDPRTIPGCALWLDAADSSTLTLSGSSVTAWNDKSGNGRHATGGVSPTRGPNGVVFNGTSQYLATTYSAVPTAETFFGVATWTGTTIRNYCIIGTSATLGRNFNVLKLEASTSIRWDRWAVSGYAPTTGVQPNVQFLAGGTFTGSSGQTAFNGGSLSASENFSFSGSGTTNIGAGVLADYFTGTINELIVFSTVLTDAERQQVEGYLAWKWALQANLPATYPFKSAPPIMRAFQPMDVSGASLWLDAADPSTLSFSGPNVTQWRDKSGTGNHYATGGAITYSNQALVFPGNATMSNTNPINFSAGTTPSMTTFVVVSTPDGSAERGIFQYGQISCSKTGYAIYVYTPSEVHCTLYCGDLMVSNAITTNTRMMVADVVTYSGTPGSLSRAGWINGAAMTTTNATTTGVNLNLASSSVIGNVAGGFWNGTMNEILYFNRALSTAERQEIEGYLAAKWNLPVRVPTTHPYRNVLPSTPLFAPPLVSALALWLDAADTTTLTLSGSTVTAWADKSGNGRNAVGTTSNPTYNATGFNSRPTVTFSNNILTSSGWSLAPNRQFAWFIVVHVTSTANVWHRILVSATGGYPNGYLGTHSNTYNFLGIAGSTTVTAPIATGTTNPQLVTYLFGTSELSANTTAVSVNGGTFSTLAGNTGGIGTSGLSIGSEAGGSASEGFLGHLSEVICYNSTVTQPQRQQVEGYLAWKWGLQARLPSTHPFAKFRP